MKILLVDDDGFLRDMYTAKFVEHGHEVDVADGAASVIAKLQKGPVYDLIILDMVMPGTSGVELLQIIRAEFPDQTKCCIFLSNQGQEEDIREATEAGAVGYIIKAESIPSEVVKKVDDIMKKCKAQ
jgi:two-component system OmpR family response regulator/two-component system response regulator CpxR